MHQCIDYSGELIVSKQIIILLDLSLCSCSLLVLNFLLLNFCPQDSLILIEYEKEFLIWLLERMTELDFHVTCKGNARHNIQPQKIIWKAECRLDATIIIIVIGKYTENEGSSIS